MKALYFWIIGLGVLGIIASIWLIPSKEQTALAELKAHKYRQAEGYYWEQYNKGVRTPDVVSQLSTLNENEGKLDDSIRVMESYVKEHPDDFYALRRLSELYRLNQQYGEYYLTLLRLQKIKVDWEVLQELATWYRNTGEDGPLFITLKELVATGHGDETDYMDLANLYAGMKDYKKAYELLNTRRDHFVKKVTINDILFEVWVSFELSKSKGGNVKIEKHAIELLANYLLQLKEPKLTYYAMGVIQERHPRYADYLITLLEPQIKDNPYLETLVAQIWWDHPEDKQKVIPLLQKLLKGKHLSPQLQNFAFNVYLDKNDDTQLIDLIDTINAETIEDSGFINLAIISLLQNKPILAQKMQRTLGEEFLKNHPMIGTALAVGAQDPDAKQRLDDYLKTGTLIEIDKYELLKLATTANFYEEALELGAQLPPYQGLEDYQLLDVAQAYVQMKKEADLYPLLESSIPPLTKKIAAPSLAVLDIALHRTMRVAEWLKEEQNLRENILNALYSTAESSNEYPMALLVAKRLVTQYPSPTADAHYGLALVQVGKFEQGLSLIRPIYDESPFDPQVERAYFTALAYAAKRDKSYREELYAFMQEREEKPQIKKDMLRDFMYAYLDILHNFENAIRLASILAENASPKSQDVQTLIYLWGPKATPEQIAWIEERAAHSNLNELSYWLENLNYVGQYHSVIDLFLKHIDDELDASLYLTYMDALTSLRMHPELRCAIDLAFPKMKDRKQLERLAGYAEEAIYPEARRMAWEKIVYAEPQDPIAWQKLAKATFDEHDYLGTLYALDEFFSLYCESTEPNSKYYESLYEYGMALKKQRDFHGAEEYFYLALDEIDCAEDQTIPMLEIEALVYHELGNSKIPLIILQEVYERASRDPDTAASYASFMLGDDFLAEARQFLDSLYQPGNDIHYLIGLNRSTATSDSTDEKCE